MRANPYYMAIEAYGTHATSPYLLVLQAPIGARDNALSASLYCLLQAKSAKSAHNAISENIKLWFKSRLPVPEIALIYFLCISVQRTLRPFQRCVGRWGAAHSYEVH